MKATKSKSAIQNDATDFLRATKRLLKVFTDNPPGSDEGYAHASSLRTLGRCVRGLENAKTDPELAAEMKLSMELLHELQIGFPDLIVRRGVLNAQDFVGIIGHEGSESSWAEVKTIR